MLQTCLGHGPHTTQFKLFQPNVLPQMPQNIVLELVGGGLAPIVNDHANVKTYEYALGQAADMPRSWRCWALPTVDPSLVPSEDLTMKVGSSRACWWRSWQILVQSSFWSGLRSQGTNFAAMRCMFKSDIRIACTVPYDTSNIAAMSLMDLRWSSCINCHIISTFLGIDLVEGCPDLLSSSGDVLPLLKFACYSKHLAQLIVSLPYTWWIMSKIWIVDLLSLTQNLMFALCSALLSIMKLQMYPCTLSLP